MEEKVKNNVKNDGIYLNLKAYLGIEFLCSLMYKSA